MKLNDEWIIGFFEGEGCLTRFKQGELYYPLACITQKDIEICQDIKGFFQTGNVITSNKGHNSWRIVGYPRCRMFYQFIKGRLKTKAKQEQLLRWEEWFPKLKEQG